MSFSLQVIQAKRSKNGLVMSQFQTSCFFMMSANDVVGSDLLYIGEVWRPPNISPFSLVFCPYQQQ